MTRRTAVVAGTATAVSNRVSRRQAGRWAEQDAQAYEQHVAAAPVPPPAPTQPPPSGDMSSRIAQLKELGALKEQGILTEAEFTEQKSRIPNS
ncbi:SHOCT domain-containing protein [Streptomyces sp. NPDC058401]|uniref:SHOCT domain-containing protein n=1 Tax=Streptomyces sp. NPDC058401 TaxID=3346480 RepID=UPI0036583300